MEPVADPPLLSPAQLPAGRRGNIIEIETWFQEHGKIGAQRDFLIRDVRSGEVLGRATTTWVMINYNVGTGWLHAGRRP